MHFSDNKTYKDYFISSCRLKDTSLLLLGFFLQNTGLARDGKSVSGGLGAKNQRAVALVQVSHLEILLRTFLTETESTPVAARRA